MALDLWIDSRGQTIFVKLDGPVGKSEPMQYMMELLDHPHFSPDYKILADVRDVGPVDVNHKDLLGLTEHMRSIKHRLGGSKLAIVTHSDVVFGLARMYQQLRHDSRSEIMVFRELDEARQWLEKEPPQPVTRPRPMQPRFVTP